jgi:ParB family chromosome partitioning protein
MAKVTGIAQFSQGRSDVNRVDPRVLVISDGWNSRDENDELLAHIDMLALSIAEIGVKKPIEVKLENGVLIVKDGHCRTRAAMRAIEVYGADLKTVPVISVDRYASDEELILNQVVSNSGKPLTSMEEARIYKKLVDLGWKQGDIAKKVGKTNGRISQILELLTMPASVQAAVSAGTISASLASSSVKAAETNGHSPEVILEAIATAKSEGRKVKPGDVAENAKMTFKKAFENSEIDNSDPDAGFVTIRMCVEDFEWIRIGLKL